MFNVIFFRPSIRNEFKLLVKESKFTFTKRVASNEIFNWKYVKLNPHQAATLYSYWAADSPSPEKFVVSQNGKFKNLCQAATLINDSSLIVANWSRKAKQK